MIRRLTAALAVAMAATACSPTAVTTTGPAPLPTTSTTGMTTGTSSLVPPSTAAGEPAVSCWAAQPGAGSIDVSFRDATDAWGLVEPLTGMRGHAAAWGDANGDGILDLFFGTFASSRESVYRVRGAAGPEPDRLLLGSGDGFATADDFTGDLARSSGAAFADLDGDADLDLVVSRNAKPGDRSEAPGVVFRNDGGQLVAAAQLPGDLRGRSVGVLDYDGDGLLDLFIVSDGGSGSVLLRNDGDFRFTDGTAAAGLPPDLFGLGVATADLTGDWIPDLFVAGPNRLFVGTPQGEFLAAPSEVFRWESFHPEDQVAGVAAGDVNGDGRLDLVVGHHYSSPLAQGRPVPVRLYLNDGLDGAGLPSYRDVTEEAGLPGLLTKAPHVELVDIDNDGRVDVLTSASAGDGTQPAVFRNLGGDPVPVFESPAGLGAEQYWVTAPTADVDRDGRLDTLLVEWEPDLPSLLMINASGSGNWLALDFTGLAGSGIGATVMVFETGTDRLLGTHPVVASVGYAAGVAPIVHIGLGDHESVDVRVARAWSGTVTALDGVAANRGISLSSACN